MPPPGYTHSAFLNSPPPADSTPPHLPSQLSPTCRLNSPPPAVSTPPHLPSRVRGPHRPRVQCEPGVITVRLPVAQSDHGVHAVQAHARGSASRGNSKRRQGARVAREHRHYRGGEGSGSCRVGRMGRGRRGASDAVIPVRNQPALESLVQRCGERVALSWLGPASTRAASCARAIRCRGAGNVGAARWSDRRCTRRRLGVRWHGVTDPCQRLVLG